MTSLSLLFSPPNPQLPLPLPLPLSTSPFPPPPTTLRLHHRHNNHHQPLHLHLRRRDFRVFSDDGDANGGDDYEMDEDEAVEEIDNKMDFDPLSDPISLIPGNGGEDEVIQMGGESKSFVSTQGWDFDTVVDYRINEDEFHKFQLFDCDFFVRKPHDPDNDVYDFREMYVTPPDTDVYSIPKVLAPMPDKYIRCAKSDYGCYNVTEPPIDAPRDPMYKSEREIWKIFLTKHYKNRRFTDPEFVLDFEEIYVIDSKSKSITRAKILVTAPGGRDRDRKKDLLVIRDNGNTFKIIHSSERDTPTTVIAREEWTQTRQDMERHLRKLRDFSVSNWF
ncbi:hypothetical protein RND81_01G166500 [Saponaria officinalis]|uniref:Plastid transcriptionally active 6 n=1 Tax=Saponaria officinalis TaxID=3572 RepID=A0AAW1NG40_SAPOF